MDLDLDRKFQLRRPPQRLSQNLLIDLELLLVVDVLVVAASALLEVRTPGFNPMRRRFSEVLHPGSGESGFLLGNAGFDFLSGEDKRNKNRLAMAACICRQMRQAVAAINQLFDGEKQAVILNDGFRVTDPLLPPMPRPTEN